jgi:DNA repair exonuclease SbcCD ATPase subunit
MLPRRLKLTNFMGHVLSDIDFTQFNCCLIAAINKNNPSISNGCGKSTIFKAIDYVLFDEYPTRQVEKMIRDGEERCEVIFEFDLSGEVYQVIRGRSKSGPFMHLNQWIVDKWESRTQRTNQQTQQEVIKLIKISYVAFKHSILFAQSDLEGIPFASSDKRKELLKEPLQIAVYTKYHKVAKKRVDDTQKQIDRCDAILQSLGSPEADLINIHQKIIETDAKINEIKNQRKEIEIELNSEKALLSDLKRKIDVGSVEINNQLVDLKKNKIQIQKEIKSAEDELKNISDKLINYKTKLIEKLNTLQVKKDNLKKAESEQIRNVEEIKKELESSRKKEQQGRIYIAGLQSKKARYEKPVPDNGECTQCFQQIIDHKICVDKAKELLQETLQNIDIYTDLLKKCEKKTKRLQDELQFSTQTLNTINSLRIDIASWETNIRTDQDSISQFEQIVTVKEATLKKLLTNLDIYLKRESSLKDLLQQSNIDDLNNKIYECENKINTLQNKLNNNISELSSIDTMNGILLEKKIQKEIDFAKINDLNTEKNVLNKKILLQAKVVKSFSSSGIPSLIINTVLDDLQIEVNNVLSQIRPSIQCKFILNESDDTWDIKYFIHGKERDQALISGGQKVYIALSFKFSLSRVIQRRLGIDIRFLELDEVDQPLDDAGIDAFADIIKQWSKEFKILVITHNKKLKERFNDFIVVEGDDENGSKAYYSTKWVF